jgi:hypothetical protein
LLRISWLLRVFVVLFALQLTGTHDALIDLVRAVAGYADGHRDQCPLEGPCHDCMPGCPSCHCSNALTSVVPEVGAPVLLTFADAPGPAPTSEGRAPLGPDRPSLFRPPRTLAVSL